MNQDRTITERRVEVLKSILPRYSKESLESIVKEIVDVPLFENPSKVLQKPKIATFKPLHYPEFYEASVRQNKVMWLPEEQPMAEDLKDWQSLPDNFKNIIISILRFFVQSDVEVRKGYYKFMSCFNYVEQGMMMSSFQNIEGIHIGAYAHLIDSLNLPESEYIAFMKYKEMRDKYEYYESVEIENVRSLIKAMAIFALFTEGMQLFSSFAILYFPSKCGYLKGLAQIISWSSRDEMFHYLNMTKLLRIVIKENKHLFDNALREELREIAQIMVKQEDCFIDLAMAGGDLVSPNPEKREVLTAQNLHDFARYNCDLRCMSIGLEPIYNIKENPIPFMDEMLSQEHTNFFEAEATDYSKSGTSGSWSDVDKFLDK